MSSNRRENTQRTVSGYALRFVRYALACAWILLLFPSSSNSECYDNKNSLPLAGFYQYSDGKSISVDSLTLWAQDVPGDTLLLDNARNVSQTWMPFDLDASRTTFILRYMKKALDNPRLQDTVTFDYHIQPWFVSPACGAIYKFRVEQISYTRHLIDSVACIAPDSVIDNSVGQNIKIFFK